jgi:hypothetical protein
VGPRIVLDTAEQGAMRQNLISNIALCCAARSLFTVLIHRGSYSTVLCSS